MSTQHQPAQHRPTQPPIYIDTRTREGKLKRPYLLCYVDDAGVARSLAMFAHLRKTLRARGRELCSRDGMPYARVYIYDTRYGQIGRWEPGNPNCWTTIEGPLHVPEV